MYVCTYIGKRFMTSRMITDMGLFTSMRPRMNSQRTALDETLVAILHSAMVWTLIGMYSIVSAEV